MTRHHRKNVPTERDLVALADGSLPAARRARVERAVAASPELQADLAAQRRVLAAVHHAASESAPAALRARLALRRAPAHRPPSTQRARRAFIGATVASAAAAIIAILVIAGGPAGAPSVVQAATLASRPPVAPVPAQQGNGVTLIRLSAAGLPYPYWDDHFGYKATGVRRDRLGGRLATTVYYMHAGQPVAYTILTGAAIPSGTPTHSTVENHVMLRSFTAHGRLTVTWLRRGHTCVLTATHTPLPVLLRLASWKGEGEIPY
ncbi:MAG: hypothetical protein ACR2LV_00730 [Solirubrobacteraceae bacterium]